VGPRGLTRPRRAEYDKKKYVWKLLYIYMLGYEVEFGHKQAADLIPATKCAPPARPAGRARHPRLRVTRARRAQVRGEAGGLHGLRDPAERGAPDPAPLTAPYARAGRCGRARAALARRRTSSCG